MSYGEPVRFDFLDDVRWYYRGSWVFRVVALLVGVVLTPYALYRAFEPHTASTLATNIAILLTIATPFVLFLGVVKIRHPASSLVLEDESVRFIYPSGRSLRFDWGNPQLRLGFEDARYLYDEARTGRRPLWRVLVNLGFLEPLCPIPPEVYTAIMKAAERKGLRMLPPDWEVPSIGRRSVLILGASSSP